MNILISTGIYPPKIGGPAQYSKNLEDELMHVGNEVKVVTYTIEDHLPLGVRHFFFLFKIIPHVIWADAIIVLDTFSVALPTVVLSKIFRKKIVIRSGGDFLWESYVERTGKQILLRNFYRTEKDSFSIKERLIFNITKWILRHVDTMIFSTAWQRDIFTEAYELNESKNLIIENYYGQKEDDCEPSNKHFITSSRNLKLKNISLLKSIFEKIKESNDDIKLVTENIEFSQFMDKIKTSYAVVLVSLGDISPNLVLDAIRYNKPFICTRETGIFDRIKDAGTFVDPLDQSSIAQAVLDLLDEEKYELAQKKVKAFSFTHTWAEIAQEFLAAINNIHK